MEPVLLCWDRKGSSLKPEPALALALFIIHTKNS